MQEVFPVKLTCIDFVEETDIIVCGFVNGSITLMKVTIERAPLFDQAAALKDEANQ